MTANEFRGADRTQRSTAYTFLWLAPLVYLFLIGLYLVARYSGHWAESDSSSLTQAITVFSSDGVLVPDSNHVYANGYSYQSISAFLMALTGVEVTTLQQVLYPLLASLVALPALLLFRELTGNIRGAVFGSLLLFTQPEFLFVILRSSHEKFTRSLMLLCLFLLFRSINASADRRQFALYVGFFYLSVFAIIASNSFIAHSFIFALAVALFIGQAFRSVGLFKSAATNQTLRRLPYVLLASIVGVYVFIFYVYPPAFHQINVYQSIWDQVAALFLSTDVSTPTNAYAAVSTGWTSVYLYLLVSAANWLLLGTSFIIWSYQGIRWLWYKRPPGGQTAILIWLMYAAFGGQGFLSIIVDFSGALSSNAQQRLFPSISVFAVAIVVTTLMRWEPQRSIQPLRFAAALLLFSVAVLSVLKATNEPLVSNTWSFYKPDEIAAVGWSDSHVSNSAIWTDFDERLVVAFHTERLETRAENNVYGGPTPPTTRLYVLTDVNRVRSPRLNRELPVPPDANRVYDNGQAEVYRLRPETPYQR
jgi:hypothetical protein